MDDQTHPVPDAVCQFVFESGRGEFAPASGVDVTGRHAGTHQGDPRFACATYGIMSHEHVVGIRSAHDEGPRHVGVVTIDERTEVDHDGIACGDGPARGLVVGQRGVGPARDNRVEADTVGTKTSHRRIELIAKVALGDSAEQQVPDFSQCCVGDCSGTMDAFDLGWRLRPTKFCQHSRHVDEIAALRTETRSPSVGDQRVEGLQTDVGCLDPPVLSAGEKSGHRLAHFGHALADDNLDVDVAPSRFVRGLFRVPTVSDERHWSRQVGRHHDDSRAAAETREPSDVCL